MANTWPGLNSSSLAVGLGAKGRRGGEAGRRGGGRRAGTQPSGFLQQALTLFLRETRATRTIKYLNGQTQPEQARLGLVN